MDPMYCEDLRGRLFGLLILLEDRMEKSGSSAHRSVHRCRRIRPGLEELAGFPALAGTPITDPERGAMVALAQRMQTDDNVPRALAFCPRQVAAPADP